MAKILATKSPSHPVRIDLLREELPAHDIEGIELPAGGIVVGEQQLSEAIPEYDALFLRPGHVTDTVLASNPDLEMIAVHGSGYNHVDVEAATEIGIPVTHSPNAVAPSVVEHTFLLMLALLRNLLTKARQTRDGEWEFARSPVEELSQKTVGVVGLGTIGFAVARRLRESYGSAVIGYDPYVTGERESPIYPRTDRETIEETGVEFAALSRLFEKSDIVTLHVPLTDETEQMIGPSEFESLSGGYLVNTARGEIIAESELLSALNDGTVGGAALDVMTTEPPSPNNPLLQHENVIVTPHIAGVSDGYLERAPAYAGEKFRAIFSGRRPKMVVNPTVFSRTD